MSPNNYDSLHADHEAGSFKHKIGAVIGSHKFEFLLVLCIFADMGLVAMEISIDHTFFCIDGDRVHRSRGELKTLAASGGGEAPTAGGTHGASKPSAGGGDGSPAAHFLALAPPAEDWSFVQLHSRHDFSQRRLGSHPAAPEESHAGRTLVSHAEPASDARIPMPVSASVQVPEMGPDGSPALAADGPISEDPEWGHADPTDIHPSDEVINRYGKSSRGHGSESGGHGSQEIDAEEREWEEPHHDGDEHGPLGHGAGHGHGEHALVCEDKHGEYSHHIAHNCHLWSVIILSFFMFELLVKIWISPSGFFKNPYHVFDLVVVSVSLFVDTVFQSVMEFFHEGVNTGNLDVASMILLTTRLWRIARIIHGIFEVFHAQKEEMDELELEISEGKSVNEKLLEKIARLESQVQDRRAGNSGSGAGC